MKSQSFILIFILAEMLLWGCSSKPFDEGYGTVKPIETSSINATFEYCTNSKTQMTPGSNENIYKVIWEENDFISVNGVKSKDIEIHESKSEATFSFVETPVSSPFFAIYSGNTPASYSNGGYSITLPETQDFAGENRFDPKSAIMAGYSEQSTDLIFSHLMAYLRITVSPGKYDDAIAWIKVAGRNKEALSGLMRASYTDGNWKMEKTEASCMETRLDCGSAGASMGSQLIVAIPAGNYPSGIKITVRDKGTHFQTKESVNEFIAEGGIIYDIDFTYEPNGTVVDGEIEGEIEAGTISLAEFKNLNSGESSINSHSSEWSKARLVMDYRSLQKIRPTGVTRPTYTRITTLKDGTYILTWQNSTATNSNGNDTFYALSKDLKTWEEMGYLWKSEIITNATGNFDNRLYTNANTLQLSNGELLAVASYRASKTYSYLEYRQDHGIIIKRSKDGGRTWFGEKEIYHGPCWEAHLIELPDGEIQCFFSESRPWISSSHSGTVMVYTKDGGETWYPELGQDAHRVMRKTWWNDYPKAFGIEGEGMYCYTYQMPVGIILNGTDKFAFAMESARERVKRDDGTTYDSFEIAIVFSPDDGEWVYLQEGEVTPGSQRIDRVCNTHGAAPYLLQFPSGETLLAYGKSGYQKMHFGNSMATEFGSEFDGLPGYGSWGGLGMDGSHSIVSCMRDNDNDSDITIGLARYNLNHSIKATSRTVVIDGDNSEWLDTDEALFIGSKCQAQATLRCSQDGNNYYFLMEVRDENLSENDKAYLMLTPSSLGTSSRRIEFDYKGTVTTKRYSSGRWSAYSFSTETATSFEGIEGSTAGVDKGFIAEIKIPRSVISPSSGKLKVNFGYYDKDANVTDMMTSDTSVNGWIEIKGL